MAPRIREDEVNELLSLGIVITRHNKQNQNDLEGLVDDTKQAMIRDFRTAYNLKDDEQITEPV